MLIDKCIGSGQAGNRIALEFSKKGIPACYLNFSRTDESGDIKSFDNRLIVGGQGTNRDPKIGYAITTTYRKQIREFITTNLKRKDKVLLAFGGGGGSGAGSATILLDILSKYTDDINILYTTPLKTEAIPETPNSIKNLNRIIPYAQKGAGIILVDNQRVVDRLKIKSWAKVNEFIVNSIFRSYSLSTLRNCKDYLDFSTGFNALDEREFLGTFYYGKGFLDIREVRIKGDVLGLDPKELRKVISTSSLFFGNYDSRTTKTYVVSIGFPIHYKQEPLIHEKTLAIFETVQKYTRCNYAKQSSYFSDRIKNTRVDLLLAGLTQSKAMNKTISIAKRAIEKFKKKEDIQQIEVEGLEY